MAVVHVLPSHVDWREQSPSIGLGFLHDSYSTRAAAAWVGFLLDRRENLERKRALFELVDKGLSQSCRLVSELVLLNGRRPAARPHRPKMPAQTFGGVDARAAIWVRRSIE
jgi:hypothetical protein